MTMATEEETKIAVKKALQQELESVSGMLDGKCVGVEHRWCIAR